MTETHAHHGLPPRSVNCYILTVSDSRTEKTDTSGKTILESLKRSGHNPIGYHIVKDDPIVVTAAIEGLTERKDVEVVLVNGGTGISKRDQTIEAVSKIFQSHLPGFGELFRILSYEQIGSASMLSRASAGICHNTVIFAMPGSTKAVQLAMEKLIAPELSHIIDELRK